jgi:hypothetical protein
MCPRCNSELDRRFEKKAKPLILSMLMEEAAVGPEEAEIVGLWFVKTWVLLAHPELQISDPGITPESWGPFEHHLDDWIGTGAPPPRGMSAWLTRLDRTVEAASTRRIAVPTVIADGNTFRFRSFQFGLGKLDVSVLYHPDWVIEHPLEAESRAARIWPPSGDDRGLDWRRLPLVPLRDVAWLKGPTLYFHPGVYGKVTLPPLSPSIDFLTDLGPDVIRGLEW